VQRKNSKRGHLIRSNQQKSVQHLTGRERRSRKTSHQEIIFEGGGEMKTSWKSKEEAGGIRVSRKSLLKRRKTQSRKGREKSMKKEKVSGSNRKSL